MEHERSRRPGGDFESNGGGLSPHLADYWQIILRRFWLVLLVFAITTASAIWAVSRQRVQYQASLSLQVNDPFQRTRALNPTSRISGMDVFVDPIESEIQVLKSGTISLSVVNALGLRLEPTSPDLVHSDLFRDAWVDPQAEAGSYELVYNASGQTVRVAKSGEASVAGGQVGLGLDAGLFRLTPTPPPTEARTYEVQILPLAAAVQGVRSRISAVPREYTNLIDVTYLTEDPAMARRILVQAAEALRSYGEIRVSTAAKNEVTLIEQELQGAREQLARSPDAIKPFKESQAFTSLSAQGRALVDEAQALTSRQADLERQRSLLSDMAREMARVGAEGMDLVEMEACGAARRRRVRPRRFFSYLMGYHGSLW